MEIIVALNTLPSVIAQTNNPLPITHGVRVTPALLVFVGPDGLADTLARVDIAVMVTWSAVVDDGNEVIVLRAVVDETGRVDRVLFGS